MTPPTDSTGQEEITPLEISRFHGRDLAVYQAGVQTGLGMVRDELEQANTLADLYFLEARGQHRRETPPRNAPLPTVSYAEIEQRRNLQEAPPQVTVAAALASWGFEPTPTEQTDPATTPVPPSSTDTPPAEAPRPTYSSRRRTVSNNRTVIGHLATDPEAVQAGRVQIVKLRVIENTGEYRAGGWVDHDPTTHFVEAKFELGQNVVQTLHRGDGVIVVGLERSISWGEEGQKSYGRVIEAEAIAPNLARATAVVTRNPRRTAGQQTAAGDAA